MTPDQKNWKGPNAGRRLSYIMRWLGKHATQPISFNYLCETYHMCGVGARPSVYVTIDEAADRVVLTNLQPGDVDTLIAACDALGFPRVYNHGDAALARAVDDRSSWLKKASDAVARDMDTLIMEGDAIESAKRDDEGSAQYGRALLRGAGKSRCEDGNHEWYLIEGRTLCRRCGLKGNGMGEGASDAEKPDTEQARPTTREENDEGASPPKGSNDETR